MTATDRVAEMRAALMSDPAVRAELADYRKRNDKRLVEAELDLVWHEGGPEHHVTRLDLFQRLLHCESLSSPTEALVMPIPEGFSWGFEVERMIRFVHWWRYGSVQLPEPVAQPSQLE